MVTGGYPVIDSFFAQLYGAAGVDTASLWLLPMGASGLVFNGNPPYYLTDFLATYPKFFGSSTYFNDLQIVDNAAAVTGFTSTQCLSMGQLVVNASTDCIAPDTVIAAVDSAGLRITLSQDAIGGGTDMFVYESPPIPLIVLQMYINLAEASVMQARYFEAWPLMMALFIAHYATLWLRTENIPPGAANDPASYASQVASGGLTKGILVHRTAGDVSATNQIIQGYEQWGAWSMTQYGELFITMARATCMGPVWVP